jgi:hypothetical protein
MTRQATIIADFKNVVRYGLLEFVGLLELLGFIEFVGLIESIELLELRVQIFDKT